MKRQGNFYIFLYAQHTVVYNTSTTWCRRDYGIIHLELHNKNLINDVLESTHRKIVQIIYKLYL